ncbi:MAG: GTP-binding protein [Candidatus Thalassarchaeaceae archaeon]|nr:GTP-binding protein [Candidatus Thalassarchaeaceae archaeon]
MNRRELARALTRIESGENIDIQCRNTDHWLVLGVTGAPGVGKSCLVDHLIRSWVKMGYRVAVLAVDPSSPVSGGALLGDRMRMQDVDSNEDVYVRSIATRNHSGGLPARLDRMVDLLASNGWNRIIIETVGSGQSEVRIVAVADRLLLVEGPARGDVVQAEKAGVMELADLVAVNKSDLPGAQKTADEIRVALDMADSEPPPVLLCSAITGDGMNQLISALDQLPDARGPAIARARERLLSIHQESLLNHPRFADVLKDLCEGELTLDEALESLN